MNRSEHVMEDAGFSYTERASFDSSGHTRRNRTFFNLYGVAEIIKLCDTAMSDDPSTSTQLEQINERTHIQFRTTFRPDCSLRISLDGPATEAVLETGSLFYKNFKSMCERKNMRNARFNIDILLLH